MSKVEETFQLRYEMQNMINHKFRHFKGNIYKVICIAEDTESEELIVVYKDVNTDKVWARPYRMWNEVIDDKGTKRFTEV